MLNGPKKWHKCVVLTQNGAVLWNASLYLTLLKGKLSVFLTVHTNLVDSPSEELLVRNPVRTVKIIYDRPEGKEVSWLKSVFVLHICVMFISSPCSLPQHLMAYLNSHYYPDTPQVPTVCPSVYLHTYTSKTAHSLLNHLKYIVNMWYFLIHQGQMYSKQLLSINSQHNNIMQYSLK